MQIQRSKSTTNIFFDSTSIVSRLVSHCTSTSETRDIIIPQCFSSDLSYVPKSTKEIFAEFPEYQANTELFQVNKSKYTQFVAIHNKKNKDLGRLVFVNMMCCFGPKKKRINYISLAFCLNDMGNWIRSQGYNHHPDIFVSRTNYSSYYSNWSTVENLLLDSIPKKSTVTAFK